MMSITNNWFQLVLPGFTVWNSCVCLTGLLDLRSFTLGGLVQCPADWRESSLISSGSKLLISQVEEIELWAAPVWPHWARTQERRSIPAGAATGLFVLRCLLTGEIGGAYRRGLTLRCAHPGYTAVCKWYIHEHKHTHALRNVFVHTFLPSLPLCHTQTITMWAYSFHTCSFANAQIHPHTYTIKPSAAVISSLMWRVVRPLRLLYQSSIYLPLNKATGWGEWSQSGAGKPHTACRDAVPFILKRQQHNTAIKALFIAHLCLQCNA